MKKALLIGVENYGDSAFADSHSAISDVRELAVYFGHFGFETRILENPGADEMLCAVSAMADGLGKGDQFLLFYTGRGAVGQAGEQILAGADDGLERLASGDGGIPLYLLEATTRSGGFDRAFLIDISAPGFADGGDRLGLMRKFASLDIPAGGPSSCCVLRSSERLIGDQECGSDKHGAFAEALLDILEEKAGGPLSIDEAFAEDVKARMAERSRKGAVVKASPLFESNGLPFPVAGGISAGEAQNAEAAADGDVGSFSREANYDWHDPDLPDVQSLQEEQGVSPSGLEESSTEFEPVQPRPEEPPQPELRPLSPSAAFQPPERQEEESGENNHFTWAFVFGICAVMVGLALWGDFEHNAQSPSPLSATAPTDAMSMENEPFVVDDSPHQPGERKTLKIGSQELALRWCPPGSFTMGSPTTEEGRDNDEAQHRVTLTKGFWMGETEVTQGLWKEVMNGETVLDLAKKGLQDDGIYKLGGKLQTLREYWNLERDADPQCRCGDLNDKVPIYNVNWDDAVRFCHNLNNRARFAGVLPEGYEYRLPTEAQWEYACRAGTSTSLPNGAEIKILGERNAPALDNIAWYGGNSSVGFNGVWACDTDAWKEKQHPGGRAFARDVGLKKANKWGLRDMLGNVWEWCSDWSGPYSGAPETDPAGAASGTNHIIRGGSWLNFARNCRSAYRDSQAPGIRENIVGFRVALVPIQ